MKKKPDRNDTGKQKPFLYPNHELPVTRRQFLAAGLLESLVLVSAPTIGLFGSRRAEAAGQPSYLIFNIDASGGDGGGTHGTFLARTSTGELLSPAVYPSMGVSSNLSASGTYTDKYGAPMVVSLFTSQLESATSGINLSSRLRIANLSAQLADDLTLGGNPPQKHSPAKMISAYLARKDASSLPIQAGISVGSAAKPDSGTAQGSRAIAGSSEKFILVTSSASLVQALSSPFVIRRTLSNGTEKIEQTMGEGTGKEVVNVLHQLAASRASQRASNSNSEIQVGLRSSYAQVTNTLSSLLGLNTNPDDPTNGLKAATRTLMTNSVTQGILSANESSAFKAGLYAAVSGISRNELNLVMSGGDYHNGTEASKTAFVRKKATYLAAAITECNARGIALVFTAITDGGMRAGTSGQYGTDEGRWAMAQVGRFDPFETPQLKTNQIGAHNSSDGFARTDNLIGGSPETLGMALFASVLGGIRQTGIAAKVREIVGGGNLSGISDATINSLNVFNFGD